MCEVNRALGPGWNLWLDQTDSLAQRDTGWIQLYCADGQEALDTTIIAYRLAEAVNLPVMVVMDAFFLSHTYEPVDLPSQDEVDRFLPAFKPKFLLDTKEPYALGEVAPPGVYMEMRRSIQLAMEAVPEALSLAEGEFRGIFSRSYGPFEAYRCEDADIVLVMAGTTAGTCRAVVDGLREKGERVGLLRLRLFRPFPTRALRSALGGARKVAVLDRNCSFGVGGIFAQELRAALYGSSGSPSVYSYVAGLGGRDVTPGLLENMYRLTRETEAPSLESVWLGLREELLK
jgi:pyruvate/2-oxoacid:ferredoxin oxidoreductase alpha subunit